jgi:predicted transcriptional regulator
MTTEDDTGELLGRDFITAVVVFHDVVGRLLGVSAVERKCLDLVSRGPVTAGSIAQHTGLTTGAVTGLVDRLEKAGYVQRTADPADRRRVTISMLPSTRLDDVMAAVFGPLRSDMAEITGRYDAKEASAIADFLGRTTETLVRHTRALSADGQSAS